MNPLRRKSRHHRARARLKGTAARPRVSIFRSATSLTVQFIDDGTGRTLLSVQTGARQPKATKVTQAGNVGKQAAALAAKQGIKQVVFDRSGYAYHGRVKAVAEALRAGGLEF